MSTNKNKIKDIAVMAGVSTCTVSRVFNDRPYVKAEVREKVLRAAATLGYQPKMTARRDVVSVLLGFGSVGVNSYEAALLGSIFTAAAEHNLSIDLVRLKDVDRISRNYSKAVIGLVYNEEAAAVLRTIRNIPVLTINYIDEDFNYVCTDHEGGVMQAAEHLIAHGHRDIGLLMVATEGRFSWGDRARLAGYRKALEKHGIPFRSELVVYEALRHMDRIGRMIISQSPTALISCGESLTLPVKYALELFDRKIPDDISLVSFYSPWVTPYVTPELTSIKQNFEAISGIVMEKLLELIRGERQETKMIIPNDFIKGASVRENI